VQYEQLRAAPEEGEARLYTCRALIHVEPLYIRALTGIPVETEGFSLHYLGPDIIVDEHSFKVEEEEEEAFEEETHESRPVS